MKDDRFYDGFGAGFLTATVIAFICMLSYALVTSW